MSQGVGAQQLLGPDDAPDVGLQSGTGQVPGQRRLEQIARELAREHGQVGPATEFSVPAELRSLRKSFESAHAAIAAANAEDRPITPAAQWVLDNHHVVSDGLNALGNLLSPELLENLPSVHSAQPGAVATRELRVLALLRSFAAHVDSRVQLEQLEAFVQAYQSLAPLTMGELWAVPAFLQLAVLENLEHVAEGTARALNARLLADRHADLVLATVDATGDAASADERLSRLPVPHAPVKLAFVVQLVERLRYRGEELIAVLDALAQRVAADGLSLEDCVRHEQQRQGANNATASNAVTSLREIAAIDWRSFFEAVSVVEAVLGAVPSYTAADHATRDLYRHAIADLARHSGHGEEWIARRARDALAFAASRAAEPATDIGWHLVAEGRAELERTIGYRAPRLERWRRVLQSAPMSFYGGTILALTVITLSAVALDGVEAWTTAALLLMLLGAFPALDLAVRTTNLIATRLVPARPLPRRSFAGALPEEARTVLVMPVMLTSEREIAEHVERLEVHFLANPDPAVSYALLSDWCDAEHEESAADRALLAKARELTAALNGRYSRSELEPRFFLLHRRRLWNPGERCWMGWERKRGKLMELNRLLLGGSGTTFLSDERGALGYPADVRYVLTVDADTRVPIGAVRKLLGAALHPLNRPRPDPITKTVVAGYGVFQPRITPLLPEQEGGSLYQWAVSGESGMDPYAGAVSDVYQDLFGEGIYTGKGLYDLQAFAAALHERLPENAVLSHDLLEGHFARCALVSDVDVYEEFPSHSEVAAARTHRWTRGDWQLLPWLVGRHAGEVSALGKWQMIDNLRRSLTAPASLATLLTAWCLPTAGHIAWIVLVAAPLFLPGLLGILLQLMARSTLPWELRLRGALSDARAELARGFIALALLGQNAWLTADAIARALTRLVTRRHLLEWVSAAHVKQRASSALPKFAWPLKSSSGIVIVATALILWLNPAAIGSAAPWLVLLWLAPLIAWVLSMPRAKPRATLVGTAEAQALRRIARRTWRFFTTFVSAEDHHLPPDNFQSDPHAIVARRTSPTNIGMYLLATMTAGDLGWLGLRDTCARLSATLRSMASLEQHRGHLLNWYDTETCRPLEPRYVSVVDSGNLAGHLLTLKQACIELLRGPAVGGRDLTGLSDALGLFVESLDAGAEQKRTTVATSVELREHVRRMRALLEPAVADDLEARRTLVALHEQAVELADLAMALAVERNEPSGVEYLAWAQTIVMDVSSRLEDFALLPPAELLAVPQVAERWAELLSKHMLLERLTECAPRCLAASVELTSATTSQRELVALAEHLRSSATRAAELVTALRGIVELTDKMVADMEFGFLFDRRRGLFSIGYRVAEAALDTSYYDLLASEARLASLLAIARGEVPVRHWFRLGRPLTGAPPAPVLLSWSGSMFEYLMPALVMEEPTGSLLELSCDGAIDAQIAYGAARGIPWGVSESAFNVRDQALTYQYSDFGVPQLGLKRGLGRQRVVAPYATALASPRKPHAALENFAALEREGALGPYGFYDAVDFTPDRVPEGARCAVVRTCMAHHQGMSLVALGNALCAQRMPLRFHREPLVQAAALLLQERPPRLFRPASRTAEPPAQRAPAIVGLSGGRHVTEAFTSAPVTQLLASHRYGVMITAAGSGYSQCGGRAVTRWREDLTRERHGTFFYLRDVDTGKTWSAGSEPTGVVPDAYEAFLDEDRVKIQRRDGTLTTTLEVLVSTEDDAELRRITVTNTGGRRRLVDVTSYAEVVLAEQGADIAHPAFSNLFVQTEFDADLGALVASRRPRSGGDAPVWAAHVISTGPGAVGSIEHETDRLRFIGRNGDVRAPLAVRDGRPLSNTTGAVLDPVFSLRMRLDIAPGEKASLTFATVVTSSREDALAAADRLNNPDAFERASMLAWTYARAGLHFLGVAEGEARLLQSLSMHLLFANRRMRASERFLRRNRLPVSSLWRFGISGDRPIVVVRCLDDEHGDFAAQLVRAKAYWESKHLAVDLVLLNERPHSYLQGLQHRLEELVRLARTLAPARGAAFVLRADQLSEDELTLLLAAARVVLHPREGSLAEQLVRNAPLRGAPAPSALVALPSPAAPAQPPRLELFNGIGGFAADGREYVIRLEDARHTPAPWSNVIANPDFGCLVTEAGLGCSWAANSRENQLTPWSNDAVADPPAEVIYLRDERSGELWTPTPQPVRVPGAVYTVRHGQGYSSFEVEVCEIASELRVFVASDDPVKVCRLKLTNTSGRTREIGVASYVEWVLGPNRAAGIAHIVTERHESGALLARNPWNAEFGARVAFMDMPGAHTSCSGSRVEVLGRHGSLATPAGLLHQSTLTNRVGAGLDTCGALLTSLEIEPGGVATVVAILGQGESEAASVALIERYRRVDFDALYQDCVDRWDALLGAVQIKTPDRALDVLHNRWLLYQVLSCRFWGRLGFYQAGGAYGFRDQLQDSLALLHVAPELVREHLLRAAARQFEAGDVQHWWHPPSGRGVRTRCVDDRLWLPFVALRYVAATGDASVLETEVPFLADRPIRPDEEDAHFEPEITARQASLYEHCARALDVSLGAGPHGLPLMGAGDWNDGMNRVGHLGRGESTWMAWFLATILPQFAPLAAERNETERVERWRAASRAFVSAVEETAWDGAWYRRGYFDDGTPLGSATRPECRIDSLAQSWAVLSGVAQPERARRAMSAVGDYLVRASDDLILLFTPPFDRSEPDPGYVRGYVPGLRENGGQYSHAAVWSLMANARLGRLHEVGEMLEMLNPIQRARTRRKAHVYRVEPYVIAADISSEPPNAQRGGWTWYTGAAAWLYRAVMEEVLGLSFGADTLEVCPALPPGWSEAQVEYRARGFRYVIRFERRGAGSELIELRVDGERISDNVVRLAADGTEHQVLVIVG